jgi:hypothetical protein
VRKWSPLDFSTETGDLVKFAIKIANPVHRMRVNCTFAHGKRDLAGLHHTPGRVFKIVRRNRPEKRRIRLRILELTGTGAPCLPTACSVLAAFDRASSQAGPTAPAALPDTLDAAAAAGAQFSK